MKWNSNPSSKRKKASAGISSPLTAIIVSIALISLISQLASSSFAALDSLNESQLGRSSCFAVHYGVESLCLQGSPSTINIVAASGSQVINISGNTIACQGVNFTGIADPANLVLSSGYGLLVYAPDKIKFASDCIIFGTANICISLVFEGESGLFLLEAHAI